MLAVGATLEVARHRNSGPVSCAIVSKNLGLQERRLESILQALVHGGILKGLRGPFGGYKLARDPCSITVADIFKAAETANSRNKQMTPARSAIARMAVIPALAEAEKVFAATLARITLEALDRWSMAFNK
jgi:Rrf2 family protein